MPDDSRFQGDWNANKGYLQLMIDYLALAGQSAIGDDHKVLYKTIREVYKLTKGIIELGVSDKAKADLDLIQPKLWPKNIQPGTMEGKSRAENLKEEAWTMLEEVEVSLIGAIHKANLIMPRKQQQKGLKQLWEEYGIDDNNTEEAGGDNPPVL
jgi:hypothetical protein